MRNFFSIFILWALLVFLPLTLWLFWKVNPWAPSTNVVRARGGSAQFAVAERIVHVARDLGNFKAQALLHCLASEASAPWSDQQVQVCLAQAITLSALLKKAALEVKSPDEAYAARLDILRLLALEPGSAAVKYLAAESYLNPRYPYLNVALANRYLVMAQTLLPFGYKAENHKLNALFARMNTEYKGTAACRQKGGFERIEHRALEDIARHRVRAALGLIKPELTVCPDSPRAWFIAAWSYLSTAKAPNDRCPARRAMIAFDTAQALDPSLRFLSRTALKRYTRQFNTSGRACSDQS